MKKRYGKPQVLKFVRRQTKRTHPKRDKRRKALHPGKRKSGWGNIYYEYRRNRSDMNYKKKL